MGVDAGYVNFAVCGIDLEAPFKPYYWKNSALFTGSFSEEKLCHALNTWINKPEIKELLGEADEIVLERQMTMKFQAVNHWIRARYFDKTKEVHPNTYASLFGLGNERKKKKKRAVELVSKHAIFPIKKGKKDDFADAFLLATWGLINHSTELRNHWVGPEMEPVQKRARFLDLV